MGQGKMKPKTHIPIVKDNGIAHDRDGNATRKSVKPAADHWAFLEEIEAPMWVELDLAATSSYKDNDDDWFEISHPIHQCSSRQLISTFPHVGEGIVNVDFAIQELSSPKLPSSVSQSRGRTYRSREWGQIDSGVLANKRHPVQNLSNKSSRVNLGSGQTMKPKPRNEHRRGTAKTKPKSVCKSSLTGTSGLNCSNPSSIVGDSKTSSSSGAIKEEYQSVSTITSENSANKQRKLLEVSSQTVSHTSGLLSALKITLRKSCATRQASRVERDGGRQSEGCKSSSGKSSLGSSSHPGYYVKNMTHPASQKKDASPDSRSVARMPQATKDKVKVPSMSNDSTATNQDLTSKPKGGFKSVAAGKSAHLEAAKSKGVHSNAMRQHGANKQDSVTTAAKVVGKVGVKKYNRLGDGKENAMNQRTNTRAGGMAQVQKATKQIAPPKSDRTGLIVPKNENVRKGFEHNSWLTAEGILAKHYPPNQPIRTGGRNLWPKRREKFDKCNSSGVLSVKGAK